MSSTSQLTGNRRYRVQTFMFCRPLIVLQVEWRHTGQSSDIDCMGRDYDYCVYKDAELEDLTEVSVL